MKIILEKLMENVKPNAIPQILKKCPGMHDWLTEYTSNYNPKNSTEMVYIALNGPPPKCKCDNYRKFITYPLGYRICCVRGNKCVSSIEAKMTGLKNHLMQTYGVTNANDVPGVTEKRKETMLKNHGVEYAAQSPQVQQKMSATMQARTQEEIAAISTKTRNTNMERYGVEYLMHLESYQQRVKETNMERYGVEYPLQNSTIKSKAMEKWHAKSPEEKHQKTTNTKNTFQEKYGVDSYSQLGMEHWVLDILNSKEKFTDYISDKTRLQAAEELSIHPHCLYLHSKKYQVQGLFLPTTRSKFEIDIAEFLDTHAINYIIGDREILKPRELDYYIPEKNIAIECCGLYWHAELSSGRDDTYHYSKFEKCRLQGITLITIFEDEWTNRKNQVLARLTNILNINTTKINDNDCIVKIINDHTANDFIDANNVEPYQPAELQLGLYNDSNLISVLTANYTNTNNQYQLVSVSNNHPDILGMKLLFTHFIENYKPHSVIALIDNRWGWCELYKQLGFEFINEIVSYQYTNYKQRFTSNILQNTTTVSHDQLLTEWQTMQLDSKDRIWDCGQTTWVWINNNTNLKDNK